MRREKNKNKTRKNSTVTAVMLLADGDSSRPMHIYRNRKTDKHRLSCHSVQVYVWKDVKSSAGNVLYVPQILKKK